MMIQPFLGFPRRPAGVTGPAVVSVGSNATTSGSTVTVTGVTIPAGALIFIIAAENAGTASGMSVSDGGTNSYTNITMLGSASTVVLATWYVANASALSGATITYTKRASGNAASMIVLYATGITTTSPLDTAVTQTSASSGTSPSVTSGTPAVSGELFIGAVAANNTPAPSFTQDSANGWASGVAAVSGTNTTSAEGDQVNAGTGTKTFNPTLGSSSPYVVGVYGFKPA